MNVLEEILKEIDIPEGEIKYLFFGGGTLELHFNEDSSVKAWFID